MWDSWDTLGGSIGTDADVLFALDTCGDGVLDPGEKCDDGGILDGDCCDGSCRLEPAGSHCRDDDECTIDTCDSAGVCTSIAAPVTGCLQPTEPGAALLPLKDDPNDKRDILQVEMGKRGGNARMDVR